PINRSTASTLSILAQLTAVLVTAGQRKGPRPCELRALLRDEPKSVHRARPRRIMEHRRILRSDNARYARALDRAHNLTSLLATRSESLPITSRTGNDRNASPGELDSMHGG